ncbi:emp24/gp25L/p24 family/GOLD-domain-containing protein [Halteromyces radiatus]|uniref:emp24/gp25L/p24 family/GOLD-domain-containing protein n=1 Tax=Halteromyces radiatus TaxID=101107 RepID=UPI00221FD154|nr:emp24/gp25L/p24 family/GOLD-domain-containing protein [Halteromyces radiatus]KAI8098683.1 emp24/gp25L/p24 family/GOLD-domain-containing protein [Halteromyces radiatus]
MQFGHSFSIFLFLLWTSLIVYVTATSLTYNVAANEQACFYTWADTPGKKIGFYFAVQSGGSFDIDYKVTDPTQKVILDGQRERQGDFVFTARHVGEYSFCFSNDMSTFAEKLIDFEITLEQELREAAQTTQSSSSFSTASSALEETLFKISESLAQISRVQRLLRTRENRNAHTVSSTEKRILWFALLESLAIVLMASVQVFAVKSFFTKVRRGGV